MLTMSSNGALLTEEKYQKSITVNDHSPLHEVLIDKTADFATVDATKLCRRFPNLESSVFSKPEKVSEKIHISEKFPKCFTTFAK